jgi:predicted transcriptional regulator
MIFVLLLINLSQRRAKNAQSQFQKSYTVNQFVDKITALVISPLNPIEACIMGQRPRHMLDFDDQIDAVSIDYGQKVSLIDKSLDSAWHEIGIIRPTSESCLGTTPVVGSEIPVSTGVQISDFQQDTESLGIQLPIDVFFRQSGFKTEALEGNFDDYQAGISKYDKRSPGVEAFTRRDLILSIKPKYSREILNGAKTIELRRRFPQSLTKGAILYIYSTSPIRALVGFAEIKTVERLSIKTLWRRHRMSASITKPDFERYFEGLDDGFAIHLEKPRSFSRPLNLVELNKRFGFKAPQSFLYATRNLQRALQYEPTEFSDRY